MRKTIWLSLLLLLPSGAGHAQTAVAPAPSLLFTIKPLGNNVYAAIDGPKRKSQWSGKSRTFSRKKARA